MTEPRLTVLPIGERHPAWRDLTEADLWPGEPLPYLEPHTPDLSTPLAAALAYAALGWRVQPLHWIKPDGQCSCDKPDCVLGQAVSAGKHPLLNEWQKQATTSPTLIERWWTRWPAANVGLATGAKSGVLVLDVDGAEGERALAELERRHGPMSELFVMQWTGTAGKGGWQAFFAWPSGRQIGNSVRRLGPKLDIRGVGGNAVLPPSVTGQAYRWAPGRSPRDLPLEPAPAWLVELLDPPPPEPVGPWQGQPQAAGAGRYALKALESELALAAVAPEGRRNDQLNASAHALFRFVADGRLPRDPVERGLIAAATHAGLTEREARTTIASAAKARGLPYDRR